MTRLPSFFLFSILCEIWSLDDIPVFLQPPLICSRVASSLFKYGDIALAPLTYISPFWFGPTTRPLTMSITWNNTDRERHAEIELGIWEVPLQAKKEASLRFQNTLRKIVTKLRETVLTLWSEYRHTIAKTCYHRSLSFFQTLCWRCMPENATTVSSEIRRGQEKSKLSTSQNRRFFPVLHKARQSQHLPQRHQTFCVNTKGLLSSP